MVNRNLIKQNRGMTLISVIIAALLAGIVGQAIIQLFGNQAMAMKVVALREQREDIMEHYKHVLISGWDSTRQSGVSGSIAVDDRGGTEIIPAAGLHLGHDIYTAEPTDDDGWWKVTAEADQGGRLEVTQSDKYEESEQLVEVTLTVEFEAKDHPYFKGLDLVKRVEKIFFHHNISGTSTKATECGSSNSGHESKLYDKDSATPEHELYATSADGAIIQYDFASNHAKCSQVPLISSFCGNALGATFGFKVDPDFDSPAPPKGRLQTGESLCTTVDEDAESKYGNFNQPAGTDEKKRITVVARDCDSGFSTDKTGGKYITKIDKDGGTECSNDYIAPEPAGCMEPDSDYPYNSRDPEDWRGGVYKVNDDGSTACIDIAKFDGLSIRGNKGRDGRIENDGTYIHIDLGVTSASDCSIACTSIPGGNYVNNCPDYNLVPDYAARQNNCPFP